MTKREAFTIKEKTTIIWSLDAGEFNVNIAKEFNVNFVLFVWK